MNEITRIHIAKVAYDIELTAKKQLEKYIKSLDAYTQDKEVLDDIEIRVTELLAERGVKAGGVISADDIAAVREQLGEPHEFADEGDIVVGSEADTQGRRLFRSTDNAVLGGVLSGISAYFKINPLWARLAFVALLFVSFGSAIFVYLLLWIIVPAAKTATEKLQLTGKSVTLESIKSLNNDEDVSPSTSMAPVLQRVLAYGLGLLSAGGALATGVAVVWLAIAAATFNDWFANSVNGFEGLGEGNAWIAWLVFGIVMLGLSLLAGLFGLIAYAFFARRLSKAMVVSAVVITVLGLASFVATIGISASQSWRVANETRSMIRDTKGQLPKEFANVSTVTFVVNKQKSDARQDYFGVNASIRYVVDEGPARYELTALPSTKPSITVNGSSAEISLSVPESYRNSFVQPMLTVYGPAINSIVNDANQFEYAGTSQESVAITSRSGANASINGLYNAVAVKGSGSVDVGSSSVGALTVTAEHNLNVSAGTVKELTVTQPETCPSGTYGNDTNITVAHVASGVVTYNSKQVPAATIENNCASLVIESDSTYER